MPPKRKRKDLPPKAQHIFTLSDEVYNTLSERATAVGLSRSTYLELLIRESTLQIRAEKQLK